MERYYLNGVTGSMDPASGMTLIRYEVSAVSIRTRKYDDGKPKGGWYPADEVDERIEEYEALIDRAIATLECRYMSDDLSGLMADMRKAREVK